MILAFLKNNWTNLSIIYEFLFLLEKLSADVWICPFSNLEFHKSTNLSFYGQIVSKQRNLLINV